MKQNRPDTFETFILPLWVILFSPAIILLLALLFYPADQKVFLVLSLLLLSASGFFAYQFWKAGYAQALYAHYLKRWEEKEKAEEAQDAKH